MKTFKGFDKDLKCRDFQFEMGKSYEQKGVIKACEKGFHGCEYPLDIFNYYNPADSRFCEVEQNGAISKHDGDSKIASSKITLKSEVNILSMVKFAVEWINQQVDWKNAKETNIGDQSAATNTEYRSAATNTGDQSAATNTGYRSVATNTGYRSVATNTGDQSAATNTGDQSAATNTGYRSVATNIGDQSAATNTGYQSAATNIGDQSAATNTGYQSAAIVCGKEAIAIAIGYKSKAKGLLGCWITLAEWDKTATHIINVKTHKIDGETVLPDVFYQLVGGKFVKCD